MTRGRSFTTPEQTPRGKKNSHLDRRLAGIIAVAAVFSAGHHLDHIIRGNHVGWPVTGDVNVFTYSLAIYPLLLGGWLLYRADKVGPRFWLLLSGGGSLFIAAIHFGPWATEPPAAIIELYRPRVLGWVAFAWLLLFVATLVVASAYEWKLLRRSLDA